MLNGASGRTVSFVPEGGGVELVLLNLPNPNRIEPSVSGTIRSSLGALPDLTRPFKPVAGGQVLVVAYDDQKTILCDLLAAPVAGLTPCGPDVRAP